MKKKLFSVVIPFFNEEENVVSLFTEVVKSLENNFFDHDYEIIMVNDGSTDKTWEKIKECKKKNDKVIWLKLNKNYGQSIALDAWLQKASWDYIFTLDWDWQNNPDDFINLYNSLKDNKLDIVAWWRKKRKDPFWMLFITVIARFLRKSILNDWVHDSGCTLRIYKKNVIKNMYLWAEMHRYIIAIARINGYKVWEIIVNHRPRIFWKTKYSWNKSIKWFIDLFYIWFIAKYSSRPLHLFWSIGLVNFFVWNIFVFISLYQKIFMDLPLNRSGWLLLWIFLIQIWVLIFIFWIVIDLLIKNYYNTSRENRYIIKDTI